MTVARVVLEDSYWLAVRLLLAMRDQQIGENDDEDELTEQQKTLLESTK